MAKHPPERYEPGELDRTRKNLGELEADEAKRMAELFGGEVGVERSSPETEEQYRRLKMLNRREGDPGPVLGAEGRATTDVYQPVRRKPGYLDRIRNDFRAAGAEFQIIPRAQAYASLFSFILPVRQQINPLFIIKGDIFFYRSLEKLVLAVRSLLSINRREEVPTLKESHALAILNVLRDWDIETIHQELTVLQRSPRNQPFSAAAKLCRAIYRPFLQLADLEVNRHLLAAAKRLFDLDLMAYPAESAEAARIKRMGSTLKHELLHLFNDIRRRCIPLLVYLAELPYAPYPELLGYFRPQILQYLSLGPDDLIALETEELLIEPPQEREDEPEPEEHPEADAAEEEAPAPPNEADEALEFLTRLFPQSGFEDLSRFPDLIAYLKPIVTLPKNADLIHPNNPVHQVAALLSLLEELLYGFRQVIFGEAVDEEGNARDIQPEIDAALATWHRLLDELIGGRLLNDMVDFCRQIERSADHRYSEAGARQEYSLQLRIKRTLLPLLEVHSIRGFHLGEERNPLRLYQSVKEFSRLLEEALRLPEGGTKPGIRNPHAPFHFEIEGFVIRRFRRYLQRKGMPQDNRHLVQYTYKLVQLLDYLINDPASHLYRQTNFPLYRHEEGHREIPIYTVGEMETVRIIEGSEVELTPPEEFLDSPDRDSVSGLLLTHDYSAAVKRAIEDYHKEQRPLTIAVFSVPELRILGPEERDDQLRVIGHCVRGEIREYSDLPYRLEDDSIPIILPETSGENALLFCRRLARSVLEKLPLADIHIALTPYHPTWSAARMEKCVARTAAEAERRRAPSMLLYRQDEDSFEELPFHPQDREQ